MAKLSDKQARFVDEYLIDLNATQAAIRAGYSEKTSQRIGSENLSKPLVQHAIQKRMDRRSERTLVAADRVITELAKIAFANMREFAEWGPDGITLKDGAELSEEDAACIAELSQTTTAHGGCIRFKLHDKLEALEKLGRHLKLFVDGEVNINIDLLKLFDELAARKGRKRGDPHPIDAKIEAVGKPELPKPEANGAT